MGRLNPGGHISYPRSSVKVLDRVSVMDLSSFRRWHVITSMRPPEARSWEFEFLLVNFCKDLMGVSFWGNNEFVAQ